MIYFSAVCNYFCLRFRLDYWAVLTLGGSPLTSSVKKQLWWSLMSKQLRRAYDCLNKMRNSYHSTKNLIYQMVGSHYQIHTSIIYVPEPRTSYLNLFWMKLVNIKIFFISRFTCNVDLIWFSAYKISYYLGKRYFGTQYNIQYFIQCQPGHVLLPSPRYRCTQVKRGIFYF